MRNLIVLASSSPRRTGLLAEWGIAHRVVSPLVEEILDPALSESDLAENLARLKADDVANRISPDRDFSTLVIGADTLVVSGTECLGKPRDTADAERMLRQIRGSVVQVITGVAVNRLGGKMLVGHCKTDVRMRPFDDEETREYLATGEPLDKAGAFAIQGVGGRLVESIDGSYSNVVGLPRQLVLDFLERCGGAA